MGVRVGVPGEWGSYGLRGDDAWERRQAKADVSLLHRHHNWKREQQEASASRILQAALLSRYGCLQVQLLHHQLPT